MSEDVEFVVLKEVGTAFDAQLIAGVLKGEGIPYFTDPDGPVDEFTMSQHMLGQGVRILVPSSRLEEARSALKEARSAAMTQADEEPANLNSDDAQADEPAVRQGWPGGLVLALVAIIVALGILLVRAEEAADAGPPPNPTFEAQLFDGAWSWRWRADGVLAYSYTDADNDGAPEAVSSHSRDGQLSVIAHDSNENGVYEEATSYGPDGRAVSTWYDEDEDGRSEYLVFEPVGETYERWVDADENGVWEKIEIVRQRDEKVLRTYRHWPGQGYELEK